MYEFCIQELNRYNLLNRRILFELLVLEILVSINNFFFGINLFFFFNSRSILLRDFFGINYRNYIKSLNF